MKPSDSTPVKSLKNIGPFSVRILSELDIRTAGDIRKLGPDLIYHILKSKGSNVSLNLVYALAAAVEGIHWLELPEEEKNRLKLACQKH